MKRAKAEAQANRNMGTHFQIRELPAIALCSDEGMVFVVEIRRFTSFLTLQSELRETSLKIGTKILEVFSNPNGSNSQSKLEIIRDSDSAIVVTGNLFLDSVMEKLRKNELLNSWDSRSVGADAPLVWTESDRYTYWGNDALDLVKEFKARNSKELKDVAGKRLKAKLSHMRAVVDYDFAFSLSELEESID